MGSFRRKVYATAGYSTTFFGPGRPEFKPTQEMPGFEEYLRNTAEGTLKQVGDIEIDEGVIANFMAPRFINQANLPAFLPFMIPSLTGKPCTGTEGACGSGGRAINVAINSILAERADVVFVAGFEVQNTMKAIYGADVLAGAAYYRGERKNGHAYFFPGIFADRAGAYYQRYGYDDTRHAMALWYEQSILNARKNSKAQEYYNARDDLLSIGMQRPNPNRFVSHLNLADCSKVSDGAASLLLMSEEGLKRSGIDKKNAIEITSCVGAEGDITKAPEDLTRLSTTEIAAKRALTDAKITTDDLALLEIHDCFSITALLSIEAIGLAPTGKAPAYIRDGNTQSDGALPTNLSGGLGGFGHPTGASGVRQMVDLQLQLTGKAEHQQKHKKEYGMMVSMGGNDKTVTAAIVKKA